MAGRLIDLDPELAFQHALAASRRGGRLAAVREAVGLTAYAAGHYGEALREFRTFRRISGSNVHLPVMADCERGLGRPDRAIDLARSEEAESLDAAGKAELAMVVSGARADLGQLDAAVVALEIPQLDLHRAFSYSPRLFRAYAEALEAVGRTSEAATWRRQAGVAEKALGIDDDLEPDIIDLGEDDDPAPVPVPKVADVLGGGAAPAPASGAAESGASEEKGLEGASELEAPEPGSNEAGTGADADHLRADPDEAASDAQADAVAVPGLDLEDLNTPDPESAREAQPEVAPAAPTDSPSPEPAAPVPTSTDALPVDAVPVGESAASVQPLQTEMLFSMDDAGTSDISSSGSGNGSGNGSVGAGTEPSGTPAVEFSEAATEEPAAKPKQADTAPTTEASEDAASAPKRKRVVKAKAGEDDLIDD